MIDIRDIENRLRTNPEPKEVSDMRNCIAQTFSKIEFEEAAHRYFLPGEDGTRKELPSVSSFIHQFEPPVDWETITERYAQKHGMTVEEVKRQWREINILSTNNGTSTHLYGEMMFYFATGQADKICDIIRPQLEGGYLIPYGNKQLAALKFWEDIMAVNTIYPLMAETRVYTGLRGTENFKSHYAGTFDLSFAYRKGDTWGVLVYDYKGLPLDTPIPTPDGWTLMGDLNEGDEVLDMNGDSTVVLHCSSVHHKPCLNLVLSDGASQISDFDHRWLVYDVEGRSAVKTTEELSRETPDTEYFIPVAPLVQSGNGDCEICGRRLRRIERIECVGSVPTRCIEVDSPTHTYLCGRTFIVTHNTNKELTKDYSRQYGKMMLPPFSHLYDEPLSHYTIQLSAYQLALEQSGFPVFDRKLIWLKDDATYEKISVQDHTRQIRNFLEN